MDYIKEDVLKSDSLIFGTPVHMGYATAIMMTFLERICWTFAKPEGKLLTISGCPIHRSNKKQNQSLLLRQGLFRQYSENFAMMLLH